MFSRIFCSGCCFEWHCASCLQAYCKVSCWLNPKYRSTLSEKSRTILTCSARVCVCVWIVAHIRQSNLLYEFSPNFFLNISANFHNIFATFFGAVNNDFRKFSATISATSRREFAGVCGGGHCVQLSVWYYSSAACRFDGYTAFLLEARGSHSAWQ